MTSENGTGPSSQSEIFEYYFIYAQFMQGESLLLRNFLMILLLYYDFTDSSSYITFLWFILQNIWIYGNP